MLLSMQLISEGSVGCLPPCSRMGSNLQIEIWQQRNSERVTRCSFDLLKELANIVRKFDDTLRPFSFSYEDKGAHM